MKLLISLACSLDPCDGDHAFLVNTSGTLLHVHLDAASNTTIVLKTFQVAFNPGGEPQPRLVNKSWTCFEMLTGMPGEFVFVQHDSNKILYASLPPTPGVQTGIFLFGSHTGACVQCGSHAIDSGALAPLDGLAGPFVCQGG